MSLVRVDQTASPAATSRRSSLMVNLRTTSSRRKSIRTLSTRTLHNFTSCDSGLKCSSAQSRAPTPPQDASPLDDLRRRLAHDVRSLRSRALSRDDREANQLDGYSRRRQPTTTADVWERAKSPHSAPPVLSRQQRPAYGAANVSDGADEQSQRAPALLSAEGVAMEAGEMRNSHASRPSACVPTTSPIDGQDGRSKPDAEFNFILDENNNIRASFDGEQPQPTIELRDFGLYAASENSLPDSRLVASALEQTAIESMISDQIDNNVQKHPNCSIQNTHRHVPLFQIITTKEHNNTRQEPAARSRFCSTITTTKTRTRPRDNSPEPIVEVKNTSSSSSASSSSVTPKSNLSPVSSRHSSDCEPEHAAGPGQILQKQQHQSQHCTTSSSSSRLIRRRTVRKSYHHRATEEKEEKSTSSSSHFSSPQILDETKNSLCLPLSRHTNHNSTPVENGDEQKVVAIIQTGDNAATTQVVEQEEQKRLNEATKPHFRSRPIGAFQTASGSTSSQIKHQLAKSSSSCNKFARSSVISSLSSTNNSIRSKIISQQEQNQTQKDQISESTSQQGNMAATRLIEKSASSHQSSSAQESLQSSAIRRDATGHEATSYSSHITKYSTASASSSASLSLIKNGDNYERPDQGIALLNDDNLYFRQFEKVPQQRGQLMDSETVLGIKPDEFFTPNGRLLGREIGIEFAELENALSSSNLRMNQQHSNSHRTIGSITSSHHQSQSSSSLSERLFSNKQNPEIPMLASPTGQPVLEEETRTHRRELESITSSASLSRRSFIDNEDASERPAPLKQDLSHALPLPSSTSTLASSLSGTKIQELLNKTQRYLAKDEDKAQTISQSSTAIEKLNPTTAQVDNKQAPEIHQVTNCKAVMNESIERIDQKMSDACKKLNGCNDTEEAIDLLKLIIQMIEKAWSVPLCGDDLGFRLCNSLRQAGGLDIILSFINEAEQIDNIDGRNDIDLDKLEELIASHKDANESHSLTRSNSERTHGDYADRKLKPLRLDLSRVNNNLSVDHGLGESKNAYNESEKKIVEEPRDEIAKDSSTIEIEQEKQECKSAPTTANIGDNIHQKDTDSDVPTSDLGLDSTSIESFTYVSAEAGLRQSSQEAGIVDDFSDDQKPKVRETEHLELEKTISNNIPTNEESSDKKSNIAVARSKKITLSDKLMKKLQKEELVFLSARMLSQCLTSENRDYIVSFGMNTVVKLACDYTTLKMKRSRLRQLMLSLPSNCSTVCEKQQQKSEDQPHEPDAAIESDQKHPSIVLEYISRQQNNDIYSSIGAEILQNLFKHSEETCSKMISLGALKAILYSCRSTNVDTLRHCASALTNLALHGGPDSHQNMIEQKAHVWLFPLAFNEDDNVQYYACLAIVILAANQEIEMDVIKSSTLDLVEPFVTNHEPRKFAESTTSHIHGQSANWLNKLIPLLESKREEARNLACFHFAMEAYIKREQGQTQVFQQIGAIEPLRKAGSLPMAIASKFACQALRLIGEEEPHKLSQQVPLWTCDDVGHWILQIGFERYKQAFKDSHVDGDLLLQLDDDMLKSDIGIENGIIRRRFLRELSSLKRIADYSSVDKTGLSTLLVNMCCDLTTAPPSMMMPMVSTANVANATGSLSNRSSSKQQPATPNIYIGNSINNNMATRLVQKPSAPPANPPSSLHSSSTVAIKRDFIQYLYPILQLGVTRDNIHLVDCDQLLAECKIMNPIHRLKLAQSVRLIQERMLLNASQDEKSSLYYMGDYDHQKTLDVFVSYRRSTGSQLASLLKVHLQLRGFSVFIDVERLEAGKFDNNLLESIKRAKNFILVLSPNALDRCIGDLECKDWVHKEIVAALGSNCNIIPIIDNFHWPDAEQLPEDMRSITYFNGVRWIHDYQDACVDKLERFICGELNTGSTKMQPQSWICSQVV